MAQYINPRRAGLTVAVVGLLIQLVPYGRDHTNPPTHVTPPWDARTEELATRACFDCHSHRTVWPWYSSIAPVSWVMQHHVEEGRSMLNFSAWDQPQDEAHEAADVVQEGEMPLWDYLLMHPEARLTDAEKQELIQGLERSVVPAGEGGAEGAGAGAEAPVVPG